MNTRHTLAAVLVALLLAACGGGGDFEDDGRAVLQDKFDERLSQVQGAAA